MNIIKDGTGNCFTAKVNSENRLFVNAIISADDSAKAQQGEAFVGFTGLVNLTSASESAILYLINNEDRDLIVAGLGVATEFTTGGSSTEATIVKLLRNPTAGTIVSGGSSVTAYNRNFGSSKTLDATILSGSEGSTFTDGEQFAVGQLTNPSLGLVPTTFTIPKGSSIGVTFQPPTGNTNLRLHASFTVHLDGFND